MISFLDVYLLVVALALLLMEAPALARRSSFHHMLGRKRSSPWSASPSSGLSMTRTPDKRFGHVFGKRAGLGQSMDFYDDMGDDMSEESDEPDYSSLSPDDVKVLREIYGLKDRNDLLTMSESSLNPKFWKRGGSLSNELDDPMTPPQLTVKDNELVDIAPYGNDVIPYGTDDSEESAYLAYKNPFEQNERLLSKENEKAALISYLLSRVHGRKR